MIERFKVEGHSMEPAIEAGQQFFVNKITKPHSGDVVVLKHPERDGMFLVKRIKEQIENGEFLVEGDNTGHSEKFAVRREQIVGKLSFCYWPLKKFGFVK